MNKNNLTLIIIFFCAFTFISGFYISTKLSGTVIKEVYIEQDIPMLLVEFDGWGENEYDLSETLFTYFIYNFGNTEAKNVKVKCNISDTNDILIEEYFFNIGNVASNSYDYEQSSIKSLSINTSEYLAICYLESVDGEYINLFERLNNIG